MNFVVGTFALLVALAAPAAHSQSVLMSISQDASGCACYLDGHATFYVVAENHSYGGLQGAEFSIEGLPDNYAYALVPNPQIVAPQGDPLTGGVRLGFASCQEGTVTLYEVQVQGNSGGAVPFIAKVAAPQSPSNPAFPCPTLNLCDGPAFTQICVPESRFSSEPSYPQVGSPSPANEAANVSLDPVLTWEVTGPCHDCCFTQYVFGAVDFGTSANPPRVLEDSGERREFSPGPLVPNTTYYWRVRSCRPTECVACSTSPVWSFTTGPEVSVDSASWEQVKRLYR